VRDEISRREHLLKAESRAAQNAEFCGMIGRGPASQQLFDLIPAAGAARPHRAHHR
jgi:hypothetical protein